MRIDVILWELSDVFTTVLLCLFSHIKFNFVTERRWNLIPYLLWNLRFNKKHFCKDLLIVRFICVCMCFSYMYVCVPHSFSANRSQRGSWLSTTMWVLAVKSKSSARAASTHWAISPSFCLFLLGNEMWHTFEAPWYPLPSDSLSTLLEK